MRRIATVGTISVALIWLAFAGHEAYSRTIERASFTQRIEDLRMLYSAWVTRYSLGDTNFTIDTLINDLNSSGMHLSLNHIRDRSQLGHALNKGTVHPTELIVETDNVAYGKYRLMCEFDGTVSVSAARSGR